MSLHRRAKRLSWPLLLATVVHIVLGLTRVDAAAPEDAFLDQPLPKSLPVQMQSAASPDGDGSMKEYPMLRVPSFWGGVQLLGALSGKTVHLPDDLPAWPDAHTEANWGMSIGASQSGSVRELFERLCLTLNLSWHYDAKTDAILLEPEWERSDPRTGKELLGVLTGTRPVRSHDLKHDSKPNRVGGHNSILDPWRLAFDSLLSRPENFRTAGDLRLYHDSHGHDRGMSLHLVENLCAGKVLDSDGHPLVLVLNKQTVWSTKDDAGDLAYYLFDEEGKFQQGGVYAIAPGQQSGILSADIKEAQIVTVTFGWRMGSNPVDLHFVVSRGDLVLESSTDEQGVVRNAEQTRHLSMHPTDPPQKETVRLDYHVPPKQSP